MVKRKTEDQRRREYETREEKLETQFRERMKKAGEKQRKASDIVNKLQRDYQATQNANRRKYYHGKKVRARKK